jgi:hypothetical protein
MSKDTRSHAELALGVVIAAFTAFSQLTRWFLSVALVFLAWSDYENLDHLIAIGVAFLLLDRWDVRKKTSSRSVD